MSRLSRLFSTSDHAYIVYRFVEKLFCATSGSEDLASSDISFDAKKLTQGFGVKTFVASSHMTSKREKVAEFTKHASSGLFAQLPHEELALAVAQLRNARLSSDAAEIGVSLDKSAYHCLIRVAGNAFVHEEPMELIDISKIQPTNQAGKLIDHFPSKTEGTVYFTDGKNSYQFVAAKNTLVKTFNLGSHFTSDALATPIDVDIWSEVLGNAFSEPESAQTDVDPFVILPLYSTKSSIIKEVPLKSGINQWNAGGRARSFGESYIPVPAIVHQIRSGFFPDRETKFQLHLPNGEVVSAKICQQGDKALMSDPNDKLCKWLFSMIDGDWSKSESRFSGSKPYSYDDLVNINKDSVRVSKSSDGQTYFMESAPLGSFEQFVASASDAEDTAQ